MNPKISRKMDMVCEVFRRDKYRSHILQLLEEEWFHPLNRMEDYSPEEIYFLTESNRQKKYKGKKVRIKNNKGQFVDIGKQKNDEPHSGMVEFPPDDSSKLIQVGGISGYEEGREIITKFKKGKKCFKDFQGRRLGINKNSKFNNLGDLDLVV